ncbi:hypothetical protein [Streptomyces pseudovenezuelae]|uniref:DUF1524 domain-containing protein n=1 Tax=Streptomyces pseudovenezuelae TaxID=67350 RepID=A0ABT6M497_9ACTN|nr:hypothetical protein [Streptomyces pseudovenezuelae]MDH6222955.1 hypothetical protein [Streptomyces pseudovenezuelae]
MPHTPALATAATVLSALAALLTPAPASATEAAPGETVTLPVRDALQTLPVEEEDRTGYERSKFRHWTDADRDGCNTRAEVLLQEAVTAPATGPSCSLTRGNWHSPYDDQYLDSARKLDVDHLLSVPATDHKDEVAGHRVNGIPLTAFQRPKC